MTEKFYARLQRVDDSLGFVIPDDVRKKLDITVGDTLIFKIATLKSQETSETMENAENKELQPFKREKYDRSDYF